MWTVCQRNNIIDRLLMCVSALFSKINAGQKKVVMVIEFWCDIRRCLKKFIKLDFFLA